MNMIRNLSSMLATCYLRHEIVPIGPYTSSYRYCVGMHVLDSGGCQNYVGLMRTIGHRVETYERGKSSYFWKSSSISAWSD